MNALDIIELIAKIKKEKILKQMQFKRPEEQIFMFKDCKKYLFIENTIRLIKIMHNHN